MPRYFVTRTLTPLTDEQLHAIARTVTTTCDELGMQWIRSHLSADGRHCFCEFEAPSSDVCREHSQRANLPFDEVIPVNEILPTMFK